MKFIHISDLHFGKNLFGYSLVEEQDQVFWVNEFLKLVKKEQVDAVCIAGDIYDRTFPAKEAVALLDYFITELAKLDIYIFMIAGNHDSGTRLQFGSSILNKQKIYIAGEVTKEVMHVTLQDEYGPVTFWLVPYLFPAAVQVALEDDSITGYDNAMQKLLQKQDIDFTKRNVIISHQTVMNNGKSPEIEGSETSIGGVGDISVEAYNNFDYVALGHIHASQKIKEEHIRYSGSPLCYHFGELKKANKGPVIVTLKEKGSFSYRIEQLPILHQMREIKGIFNDILKEETINNKINEYLRVVIQDDKVPSNARQDLLDLFDSKNSKLMEIVHEPINRCTSTEYNYETKALKTVEDYFKDFYMYRNNEEFPSESDQDLISFISTQVYHAPQEEKPLEPSSDDIDKIIDYVMKQGV